MAIVRELVETLAAMRQMVEDLRAIARQKKELFSKNEVQELPTYLAQETKLLKLLSEHEAVVKRTTMRLQQALGLQPKADISLSEMIQLISSPADKKELLGLQSDIVHSTDALRQENELNQQLTLQSLDFVNFSLDVLYGEPEEEVVYKKPNVAPDSAKRAAQFDTRA